MDSEVSGIVTESPAIFLHLPLSSLCLPHVTPSLFTLLSLSTHFFSIQVSSNTLFSSGEGTRTLQTIGSINYEYISETIIAIDVPGTAYKGATARVAWSCGVTVKVADVNEPPTLVSPSSNLQIVEQSDMGTVPGSVSPTYPYGLQGATYAITQFSTVAATYVDAGLCNGDINTINSNLLFTEHPQ